MKTSCLYRYVLALSLLLSLNKSYAQCAAPTAATATPSASACINNGKITITGVTGGPAVSKDTTLEYAIVGYTGSGPSLPVLFQSSNVFTDLYPGTYIVSVRRNCQGTYSTEFQVSGVEVNGSYTPLSAATVSAAQLGCRLGKVTVTATGGYLGTSVYRYQRVNNITSSLWDTAAAKQTSNVFNLAAGTYYIRVFDSCGSYITREVTVGGSATTTNPYTLSPFNRKRFIRTDCGAYTYQFFKPGNTNFTNGNLVMGGTKAKTYLFGPASATMPIDSSALMTTGTADRNISALLVPANKKTFSGMDVYGPFYEKVIDSCGTVFYSDSLYLDTTSVLTATLTRSAPRCDTANLVLSLTEPGSNYTGVSVGTAKYRVRASNLVAAGLLKYTNDSGITWIANATDTNVLTSELHDGKWGIAVCADTVWLNSPDTVAFNAKVLEANSWACPGNTGLYLNPTGNFGAAAYAGTTVQFTSAPAAYTLPLSTVFNNKGQIIADPSDVTNYFFNLPVGTYTYTLTNECGQTYSDTINANTGRVITPVISATNACATGKVQILPQINTTQQGSSAINTAGGASRLRYTIQHRSTGTYLNAGGAAGTAGSLTPSVVNRGLTIAAINAPDTGWYVITVWPDSTLMKTHEFCPVMDSVHIANIPAPLASTSQFSSCRTGSTGIIIAGSTGGTAPYKYEVLDVTSGTLYGPQTSTTFTGLNVSHVFEVRVTDTCGNTSSNRNTFDTVSTKVTRIGTACLGTNTEFRVADAPGAVYRWMKGGDTVGYDRILPLTPIAITDSGMYTIIIRRATCTNDILDSFKFAVDTIPVAPTVTTPVAFCKDAAATALTATGVNLKWYNDAVGGTGTGTAPVPATTAADTFSFFVSQTSAKACESPRAELSVQVNPLPADAPVVTTPVTYCSGIPAVALTATGVDLRWFTAATGGTGSATAPVPATSSAGTTKHYVAQSTPAGCTGPRAEIQVVVNPTPAAPVVTTPIAYCAGATTTALTATTITGASLLWYTAATGGTGSATAFVPDASVAKDSIFYVSQNSDKNCEGPRAAITVNVNPLPAAPAVTTPVNLCDGKPATALTATGTTLKWYTVPTAGTGSTTAPVPSTAGTSTNTWYVSQTTAKSCEGPRAAILVNVNPTPTVGIVPKDGVDFIFCPGLNVVLQAVSATATAYQWHLEGIDIGGATMDTLDVTINGNYSVTVTNAFGCKAENTVYAFRDTTRPSVLAPTELTKCEDAMVMLYCHPGFTGYKYEWRKDGVVMTGVTTSSEGAKESGVYTVTVTNTLGCVMTTNSATIVNYPAIIKPTIVRTDPVLSLDNTYTNYQWYRNGGALFGASKAKLTMTADGEYYCYVSDKNGCRSYSDTIKVKLTSIPGTTVQELKLYPNPTTAKVIIEASEKVNVVVTDLTGQVVIRREEAKEIDLQQLADGFYFFHITDLNGLPVRVEKINKVSSR